MNDSLVTTALTSSSDIGIAKWGIAVAVMIYVIKELLKLINVIIQKKSESINSPQSEDHDMIKSIHSSIHEMKQPFFEARNKFEEAHEVITQKKDGVPLIYNLQLVESIKGLSTNIIALTEAINTLKINCNKKVD